MQIEHSNYRLVFPAVPNSQSETSQVSGRLLDVAFDDGRRGKSCVQSWTGLGDPSVEDLGDHALMAKAIAWAEIDADDSNWRSQISTELVENSHKLYFLDEHPSQILGESLVKIKMGNDVPAETKVWLELCDKYPEIKWRIDFNGSLSKKESLSWLDSVKHKISLIDFVEDITEFDESHWLNIKEMFNLQLALDIGVEEELGKKGFDIICCKPARNHCDELANWCVDNGKKICFTHYMDSPLGQDFARFEASKVFAKYPEIFTNCGLKPHSGVMIDFHSEESYVLENPRNTEKLDNPPTIQQGLYWLQTSGSSEKKWIGLSKQAILISAKSVNDWIDAKPTDVWLQSLPLFHVGGLAIQARAQLSGAKIVYPKKWNEGFDKVTHLSLVPTQVYDLVKSKTKAPKNIKLVFVGGGFLKPDLFEQAVDLGWPIMLTYGMTEAASQIASSRIEDVGSKVYPKVYKMPHMNWRVDDGKLSFQSESQLSSIASKAGIENIDPEQFYQTEDLVVLSSDGEKILNVTRQGRQVKVLGELVDLDALTNHLEGGVVIGRPDSRKGTEPVAVFELGEVDAIQKVVRYNSKVRPFERIDSIYYVEKFPKSELGKVQWGHLAKCLFTAG